MASNEENNGGQGNEELNLATARAKTAEPHPPANAPGDNRGADDLDGNKAGAAAGNKAPGPDAPEAPSEPKEEVRTSRA